MAAWEGNGRRGVVEVVTGGGKTLFAMLCMERVRASDPSTVFVILVPTAALLDQWYVGLVDDLGVPESEISTYSGNAVPQAPNTVNVMILNTARKFASEVAQSPQTCLIVDECHRSASPANSQALIGEHQSTLGLSATPQRDYDDLFEEVVVPALGRVVFSYDYGAARRDGVIADFELVNVAFDLSAAESKAYARGTRQIGALMKREQTGEDVGVRLKSALISRARIGASASMRIPAAAKIVDGHRGSRCIVFHESISHADEIAFVLRNRGHRVTTYHTGMAREMRRDNLRLFRSGRFDVLVTCRALDEGMNVPEAHVAVIASGTASRRQRIQRLGRVLRPAEGKESAIVYTLYATDAEEQRLAREISSLEGAISIRWMRIG